jgi:hypothetical protein
VPDKFTGLAHTCAPVLFLSLVEQGVGFNRRERGDFGVVVEGKNWAAPPTFECSAAI